MRLTRTFIEDAIEDTFWDTANDVLYRLCSDVPLHRDPEQVVAKVWLIGRSYAAALERGRNTDKEDNDVFYRSVAGLIRDSAIDEWIRNIRQSRKSNRLLVRQTHYKVFKLFASVEGARKQPSLASKYLHFHVPSHFFILDSRAQGSARVLADDIPNGAPLVRYFTSTGVLPAYARHDANCWLLVTHISDKFGMTLTPRDLDKVLLAYCQQLGM